MRFVEDPTTPEINEKKKETKRIKLTTLKHVVVVVVVGCLPAFARQVSSQPLTEANISSQQQQQQQATAAAADSITR
ncbi:hypothetical protein M0804_012493 [Polistes exclamans]|nr:hypothetical protein M0804_012493 [Polistes exclamans]